MAVNPVLNQSPNRIRNAFLMGIGVGVVGALILSALIRGNAASADDLKGIQDRLAAIEDKLATPTPEPKSSLAPSSVTLSAINDSPEKYIGQTVELSGKVSGAHQGVGFILVDADGSFLWVHTNANIPEGTATVKGKIKKLTNQLTDWKKEPGWPADDTTLTSRLREEVIYVEAEDVS